MREKSLPARTIPLATEMGTNPKRRRGRQRIPSQALRVGGACAITDSEKYIRRAAAIESFNPEPGTAANSGDPTALVDPTGRLAVGSGLNNL